VLGSRDPDSDDIKAWLATVGENACSGTYPEAVKWGDWVFLCVPGKVVEQTVQMIGAEAFGGKIVVDVTNTMRSAASGQPISAWGPEDSATEHVQALRFCRTRTS
jgi:predicted dinucleotide-binding enzyme